MIEIKRFTRPGCRPCVFIANYLDELKPQLEGVTISEYNTANMSDEQIEKFRLTSVPVLAFYRNGSEITRINGMTDQETILDAVQIAKEGR
jgi:thioredoxin 1